MKRSLGIILTVLLANSLVLTGAEEQKTAIMTYQVYGKMHVSLDSLDSGDKSDLYLSSNQSRLGFKGELELAPGLKTIWQLESHVNLDEAGSTLASRDTYVGLASGLGKLIAGRMDTPCKNVSRKLDVFGDQLGDTRNILGYGTSGFDLRSDNTVAYISPSLAGAVATLAYKTTDEIRENDIASGNIFWTSNVLTLAVAVEQHGAMVSGTDTNVPADGKIDVASAEKELAVRAGGAVKLDNLTLMGLYEMLQNSKGVDGADRVTYGGGIAYKLSKIAAIKDATVKAQYYISEETDGKPDTGATLLSVGVDYELSQKTIVYVAYSETQNDAKAAVSMSGGGHGDKITPTAGKDPSGVSLGLAYAF